MELSWRRLLIFSAAARLIMILFGEWEDANLEVKYTDVDYLVFTDAARLVTLGRSPYERYTYRYSPLLAWILVPNVLLHPLWGKLFFSAADLLVGHQIRSLLLLRGISDHVAVLCAATWLFNPFTVTIATRGNCDALAAALILQVLLGLLQGNIISSAFWFGIVVHFRVYPIIYSLPFVLYLFHTYPLRNNTSLGASSLTNSLRNNTSRGASSPPKSSIPDTAKASALSRILKGLTLPVEFAVVSGGTFVLVTALCWRLYGDQFLNESLLYHASRSDHRHNFSAYFYAIYLMTNQGAPSVTSRILSFLPQLLLQSTFSLKFFQDLPFCLFVQTFAFVAFNKVITSQYFVWFLFLLPLILPFTSLRLTKYGGACLLLWLAGQSYWLWWAYNLEFGGLSCMLPLWVAGIMFLAANVAILACLIRSHTFTSFLPYAASAHKKVN
ncbi:hypothetical protein CLOM_g8216 [Closterium sp. NIES-68]|nr:hypothetical protein CLOM_g8216 [Closterium sp. NIES-68]GJP66125.1 hypothetical protein CLOP_g23038 [Closterium sp. NIES-67]